MCGIVAATGAASLELVERVVDAMHHRGPDAQGTLTLGAVAIGMTRLAVMDPASRSNQPMQRGNIVVVYNGELYNYRELRSELISNGVEFLTDGDTEVVVNAIATWGAHGAAARFSGMFAFVAVDTRSQAMWIARDRFGIKPLYWSTRQDGGIAVCSEARHLTTATSDGVDELAIAEFLRFGSAITRTAFCNVMEIRPGTVLEVCDGLLQQSRFADEVDLGDAPSGDAPAALRRSIEQHLAADRDVALWLSGGFDSAILLAAARDTGRDAIALTLATGTNDAEIVRATNTAKHFGVRHEIVHADPEFVARALPGFFAAMDQPSIDGFNTYLMSRATADRGCAVAISGLGGDEVLGGYGYYRSRPSFDLAANVVRALPAGVQRSIVQRMARRLQQPPQRLAEMIACNDVAGRHAAARSLFSRDEVRNLMGSEVTRGDVPANVSDRVALARLDFDRYLRPTLLRDSDVFSMACGVELRVPMLDPAFVGSVLRAAQPPSKSILANAWNDSYLRDLAVAPKLTFAMPWTKWIHRIVNEQRDRLASPAPWGSAIDANVARSLMEQTLRTPHDTLLRVWALVVLANWQERVIEGASDTVVWRSAA